MKTNLLLLAILYLLGTSSFAASNPFDDASAAYERGDYVQGMKLFRQLAAQGHQWAQRRLGLIYAEGKGSTRTPASRKKGVATREIVG